MELGKGMKRMWRVGVGIQGIWVGMWEMGVGMRGIWIKVGMQGIWVGMQEIWGMGWECG